VRNKLKAQHMVPVGNSPAEFRAVVKSELDRWGPVIKAGNIRVGQ
jgi:tripartite-type tricarboxylate transporter receptor subunit TctC